MRTPGQIDPTKQLLDRIGIRELNDVQRKAIQTIQKGVSGLVVAPTGSGKTEAALVPILTSLEPGQGEGIRVVYITPLRALNRDMIGRLERMVATTGLTVSVRHGDTPTADRRRQAVHPPDILITTPETLQAILPGKVMRRHLRNVRFVVIDEVHQLAEDRRGTQLAVALERLRQATDEPFQRIALSATVGHPEAIAAFFGGGTPLEIVTPDVTKRMEYRVEWPRPIDKDFETARDLYISPEAAAGLTAIDDTLDESRSTLVFVNARPLAELLGSRLGMVRQDVGVHHGSLPREERERAETGFKEGTIKALICIRGDEAIVTSSGVKFAKDVSIGDEIASFDPKSHTTVFKPVTAKVARRAKRLLHIKHEFGLLRVTPNHPVLCFGPHGLEWKDAGRLNLGDALVTVGKVDGKKVATHTLLNYPNLFVQDSAVAALGYRLPKTYRKRKVTRLRALRSMMTDEDLLELSEFHTTQARYKFPPWVDSGMGYVLGFQKSDGDRHLRFFNTDSRKLLQVRMFLSRMYNGSLRETVAPMHRQSFESKKRTLVLNAQSKVLIDLLASLWQNLPLETTVSGAFLAAYLDGDGCLAIRGDRLEQIQFTTFNPINREYLLFTMLANGFKPKLWKATGMRGDGYCVSMAYRDDKARLLQLVGDLSIKAKDAGSLSLGRKPKTYYGLGPYLKATRQGLGLSSYELWKRINYSTKYENPVRGITCDTLARLNLYLKSALLEHLLQGRFGISQVQALQPFEGQTDVVNFEVQGTETYAVTGVVTHNCTSTLELGLDIGSVDHVVQYMSPRQVTSLIQRVGRSGHRLDRTSKGTILAVSADDALESVATVQAAREADLEPLHIHRNALDVLAHQIVGCALDAGGTAPWADILKVIRCADPYRGLEDDAAQRTVDFLDHLGVVRRQGEDIRVTPKGRRYYFENLSTIRDERRYTVVDLTTQRPVGILGEEFMVVKAREGLNFIVRGRPWKINKIGQDGVVYVTPVVEPNALIPGWDGDMLPVPYGLAQRVGRLRKEVDARLAKDGLAKAVGRFEAVWPINKTGAKRLVEEHANHRKARAPMPTDDRILVEAFDRFLIVHASFGEVVNATLGDLIEELLARKHLVRFWWNDAYRILYELVADTRELDVEALVDDLLRIDDETLEGGLQALLTDHLPLGFYMKAIAERFGALPRGLTIGEGEMNSLEIRFANTPIYDEAVREALLLHADFDRVRDIVHRIRKGAIEVAIHRSDETPTSLAYPILRRYVEAPELFSPEAEREEILERMRLHLASEPIHLLCFDCGHFHDEVRIGEMADRPGCAKCGSPLLTVLGWSAWTVRDALAKRKRKLDLSDEERKLLTRAKQVADLVAVYGRRAVYANSVYGVGPTTASKLLAKMHDTDKEFFNDLFEAKIRYVTTRPYWNEPTSKPKLY